MTTTIDASRRRAATVMVIGVLVVQNRTHRAYDDEELEALLDDHYAGEAQTLTTGAEHNLLLTILQGAPVGVAAALPSVVVDDGELVLDAAEIGLGVWVLHLEVVHPVARLLGRGFVATAGGQQDA